MYNSKAIQESTSHSAYLYAVRLLAKQDYSRVKILRKLLSRGYDDSHAQEALDKVTELGYLNEDNYIEGRIKAFMNKSWSPDHIMQKLKAEELIVQREAILQVFVEYEVTTHSQISTLINKKIPSDLLFLKNNENYLKQKNKIIGHIASKGHSYEEITELVENHLQQLKSEL